MILSYLSYAFMLSQKVLQLGFDWDSNEMSVMLLAKLAKPLIGAARIVINQIHIKGDVSSLAFSIPTD